MKHKFYAKSKKEQNQIQLIIGLFAFSFNLCVLFLSIFSGIYLFVILSVFITLTVIAPFFDTPALREKGKLTYYSPLFLAEREKNGVITIHGGTLLDYVYVIDMQLNGQQRTSFIIQSYLEGLLALINECEALETDSIKVRGSSHILNKRTSAKLGFTAVETDFVQKVILIYNYVNLTITYSIAKAKFSFPNLSNVRTFEAEVSTLVDRKEYIFQLKEKLKNSSTTKTYRVKAEETN